MICSQASPVHQLGSSPTANVDCGVAVTEMHLRHALCDRIDPTPAELRARGRMGQGPTGISDWKRALASYAPEAAALGLPAPVMYNMGYIDRPALLDQLVRRNAMLALIVRYAVLQEPKWRPYRGDDFTGAHAIAARGLYRAWGSGYRRVRRRQIARLEQRRIELWTEVLDPLADGRRSAIPSAPQMWPLELAIAAGAAYRQRGGKQMVAVTYRGGMTP